MIFATESKEFVNHGISFSFSLDVRKLFSWAGNYLFWARLGWAGRSGGLGAPARA